MARARAKAFDNPITRAIIEICGEQQGAAAELRRGHDRGIPVRDRMGQPQIEGTLENIPSDRLQSEAAPAHDQRPGISRREGRGALTRVA